MIFEQFPPDSLMEELQQRKNKLEELISIKDRAIKQAPAGSLNIQKKGENIQYYKITEKNDTHGVYIPKKEKKIIRALAQKFYNKKLLRLMKNQLSDINKFIQKLSARDLSQVYKNLTNCKKDLVEPVSLADEEYVKRWEAVEYEGKEFLEDSPDFFTLRGEKVRSKSEIIIADTLFRLGIPYKYEFPVKLKTFTAHADFYCLNIRKRKAFVWEHFGMMDNAEYADRTARKLFQYQKSGFFPGRNFIFTMETKNCPVSSKDVESVVKSYLM